MKRSYVDPNQVPEVELSTVRRIAACLGPYRAQTSLVVLAIVGATLVSLVPPLLVRRIVDGAIAGGDLRLLVGLSAGMIVASLGASAIQLGQKYLATWIGEQVMFDLRVALYRNLHRQSLTFFSAVKPGENMSRVLNDVQGAGNALSGTLVDLVQNSIAMAAITAFIVMLDWRLALASIGLLPLFIVPTRRVGRRRKRIKRQAQVRAAELAGILTETLSVSGALLLKVFATEDRVVGRFAAKARELMRLSLHQSLVGRWFQMALSSFEAVGPALVFGFGGWLVIRGELGLGTVVAFVTLLKRVHNPASQLAGAHVDLVVSYTYFDRIFNLLDLEPAIKNSPGAVSIRRTRGEIAFRGVSFSFGRRKGDVLRDINLTIGAGQRVAVVGPSGAGKSTLAALVPRLYDPTAGAVLLDGRDVRTIEIESLREQIAAVTQEAYLFHATVLENLRYGQPTAAREEVEAAARAAHIHDQIARLPDGYDTITGDRGYHFSGGERQRLAIARAILKNARILILDEATSNLDSQSEALVQDALEPLLDGRTSLIIAHRLSTIRSADLILVLDEGVIRERGTHRELLAKGGLYAALYREQFGASVSLPRPVPARAS